MASFVPTLTDPNNPESVAEWARQVADVVNGKVSIGEPISNDTTRLPNGVKGNLLGSFVTRADIVLANTPYAFVHNLNIPNKAGGNRPLNVAWVVVRLCHDGSGADAASTISVNYDDTDIALVTANSISLRFYIGGARSIAAPHPLTASLWFFPTTR